LADLEAGPLDYLERDELRPFPERPSFTSLVADELSSWPGADNRLAQVHSDLADNAGDLDDGFDGDYGDAISELEPPGAGVTLELSSAIETGDNIDTVRQTVQDVLPPVDTPINDPFDGPPGPPPAASAPPEEHRYEEPNPEATLS
jgi:hypothetical protein